MSDRTTPTTAPVRAGAVVCVGESMMLGLTTRPVRLRHATTLEVRAAGAESNVAIGLTRLGHDARWVSLLGEDEPGQLVLDRVRAEGVDTRWVRRVPGRPTGLMLRDQVGGSPRVTYYRAGSAASTLAPGAVDLTCLDGAAWLLLGGITPALSPSCAELVRWLAHEARERGVRVAYDVNHRTKLWDSAQARSFTDRLLPDVDLLLVGTDEGALLWDWDDDERQARRLASAGPAEVVLKRGAAGAAAWAEDRFWESAPARVTQVDPIGAGDAFAAGYLSAHLDGLGVAQRLRTAGATGAMCVREPGDYEGLPDRRELDDFLNDRTDPGR